MIARRKKKKKSVTIALLSLLCVISYIVFYYLGNKLIWLPAEKEAKRKESGELLKLVASSIEEGQFSPEMNVDYKEQKLPLRVKYTLYPPLQEKMTNLVSRYKPDFGSFVAMDVSTGKILTLISFTKNKSDLHGNLALRATFPSASIFKVVTAAAVMDKHFLAPDSEILFQGSNTSLYKKNVLDMQKRRWTREMTLKEAFGKSVNTVFAKIGWFHVGYPTLKDYSERFGFNVKIDTEIPMDMSTSHFEDDSWEIASAASGYTRSNTMSPIHGALIASVAANQGKMMSPALIERIHDTETGETLFEFEPRMNAEVVSASTADQLKVLMRETVVAGTSRSIFRPLLKNKKYKDIDVGGKTGSLTGFNPRGRYDWFVGYFTHQGRTISLAALTINEKYWTVKSAYLVKQFIEYYIDDVNENSKENLLIQPPLRGHASQ